MTTQRKAVALISGGLDSLLAVKVVQEQGIYVEGINFFTGFCVEGHTHAIRNHDKAKPKRNNALWSAEQLGIKLHIIDVIDEYKDVLINPKHGYGTNMNPCMDCKVFMIKKAKQWMLENGFDFIITGEVIGQRPMSQTKFKLPQIAKESGADDLIVRPLCAKNLEPTLPEREGWLDREKLLDITGRSRKPQFAMAQKWGIEDFAQPAGGCCFLTDKFYSAKLVDLWQSNGHKNYEMDDIMLLKVGRHLRPAPHFKLIIARDEGEGRFMQGYRKEFINVRPSSHKGSIALIDGLPKEEDFELIASVVARYGQGRNDEAVTLEIVEKNGETHSLTVSPFKDDAKLIAWQV
ncbi:MAG: tRNA (5-methylaminomethyl-2-thiouridylate)-methyltransferase [Methylococcales bacterium]|nr:tRNA (5-methylaminomethyl-2-thiouridylate)-methyltransferase [Methylococcales bacterium]